MVNRTSDTLARLHRSRDPSPGALDRIARLAARLARTPIALLSGGPQGSACGHWADPAFDLDSAQFERLHRLCRHLNGASGTAVVSDATQDPRLWREPGVAAAPHLRFIATMPLTGPHGAALGMLCVMDVRPRPRLLDDQADALAELAVVAAGVLAQQVAAGEHETVRRDLHQVQTALRDSSVQLQEVTEELDEAQHLARLGTWRMEAGAEAMVWSREMRDLMGSARDAPELNQAALLARVHPEDRDTVRQALVAAMAGAGRHGFEYRVPLPGGEVRHLRAEVRPVLAEDGTVTGLFGYSQDISDRKRTEHALLRNESLRALGQLTGGVAHDFNNLLTVVILNLEEAQEVLPPEDPLQEVIAPALHAAVRGADLTSQLLSYARRATLRPERVRPDEFFGALRPLLNRVLGERFELQVLLRHNGGSAMVDPAQLDSAIMNLILNARDAMPHGGRIVVETRSVSLRADSPGFQDEVMPGRYVVIAVADRGTGIPPHVLARVFEPFFTTKEAGRGSGMGLSMVYGFARQSGGHVTIESSAGQGTVVRLFLPVAADEEGEDAACAPEPETWSAQGKRVLLVEDQENVLHAVARMLRAFGFTVTQAMSTDEALESLDREAPFDLLFTDIVLPGPVDGLALAEEVQARAPATRILLTSGFTEHSLSADDVNGVDFLMKPYKRHELQAKFTAMFPRAGVGAQ